MRRRIKFFFQRLWRGWDDSDTWNLDLTIAKFTLPRLIRFKELNTGHPDNLTEQEWNNILDKIINSLQYTINQFDIEKEFDKEIQEGTILFGKYFNYLWN